MLLKKKILSGVLSLSMIASLALQAGAMAAESDTTTTWSAPTQAMKVDDNIVKVGIHAAASTTAFFLGGNVVAERASDYDSITGETGAANQLAAAMKFTRLGAFGSSSNKSPDPYLWNYFYNLNRAANPSLGSASNDAVYLSSVGSPMAADTTVVESLGTSYTLDRRPEVLMDTAGGYSELIKQINTSGTKEGDSEYNPQSLTYRANNLPDLMQDMYDLSDAIKKSGKTGRYGDTDAIAQNYEAYLKGIQGYLIKKLDDGSIAKKTVAIISGDPVDRDGDGTAESYKVANSSTGVGTSSSRPAECVQYITNNIIDTEKLSSVEETETQRGRQVQVHNYYATIKDIAADCDAVITAGHENTTEAKIRKNFTDAGVALKNVPDIYAADPSDVFTIRANSVENFAGVGIFGGFLYPEVLNPVYATMYIYQNFWHLKDNQLVNFANANFASASLPEGIQADGSGYNEAEIQADINEGLQYINSHSATFAGSNIEISDNLNVNSYVSGHVATRNLSSATVRSISNKAYTGKALKPSVTVKNSYGTTLRNGTDYTVTYKNNKNPGKATITIKGKGDYSGTKTVTFKIVPKKATVKAVKNVKTKKLNVTVKRDKLATGYQIKIGTNNKLTKNTKTANISKNKTVKQTFKKLKKGKKYYVKVRSYKKIDGKKAYGAWSSAKTVKISK